MTAYTSRESQQPGRRSEQHEREQVPKRRTEIQRTQVEIVCVSPNTGKLHPSTVSLPSDTPGVSDAENSTSETSRRIRKETKEICK